MRLSRQQEQATGAAYLTMSARLSGIYADFELLLAQLSEPAAAKLNGEALLSSTVCRVCRTMQRDAVRLDHRAGFWACTVSIQSDGLTTAGDLTHYNSPQCMLRHAFPSRDPTASRMMLRCHPTTSVLEMS